MKLKSVIKIAGLTISVILFFYVFAPYRTTLFSLPGYPMETVLVVCAISVFCGICLLVKEVCTSGVLKAIAMTDIVFCLYLLFYAVGFVIYPVDNESVYRWISLAFIYWIFRTIPSKYICWYLCIIAICAILQIRYGYNQLKYPWQNLSDIEGIFFNTRIMGGLYLFACC